MVPITQMPIKQNDIYFIKRLHIHTCIYMFYSNILSAEFEAKSVLLHLQVEQCQTLRLNIKDSLSMETVVLSVCSALIIN